MLFRSRASDWRAEADLRDFEEIFPFQFRSPDDPDGLLSPVHAGYPEAQLAETLPSLRYSDEWDRETLVVRLCDLDTKQIRRFAAACGVSDVASFLAALQIQNATSLRPDRSIWTAWRASGATTTEWAT